MNEYAIVAVAVAVVVIVIVIVKNEVVQGVVGGGRKGRSATRRKQ